MDTFLGMSRSDVAPALVAIVFFIAVVLISVGCTITVQWRKSRQAELEAALKQDMLQRGMSADDIVRVVEAGRNREERMDHVSQAGERHMS